jgi:hypothetical protein
VTRHLLISAAVAALTLGLSAAAGTVHRRAALMGASAASFAAFGSLIAMGRTAASKKPVKSALAVMTIAFLVRMVLVAIGTVLVIRSGESVLAFVVAFFVPYFIFAAIEGWYVASLPGGPGTPA